MADIQLPKTDTTIKTYTAVTPSTQTSNAASTTTTTPSTSTQSSGKVASDKSQVGTKDLSNFNDGFNMDAISSGTKKDTLPGGGMDKLPDHTMDDLENSPMDEIKYTPTDKTEDVKTDPIPDPDPHYDEKIIEVAGSGMGADKKFKMLPGELMAITEILKDGKMISPQEMQKILKEKYGIETQVKDGAVVSADGGRTLISDTNGNGVLDAGDLKMETALGQLNAYFTDEAKRMQMKNMILEMIEKANEYSQERQDAANKEAAKSSGGSQTTASPIGTAGATAGIQGEGAVAVSTTPATTVTTAKPAATATTTTTKPAETKPETKTTATTKTEEKKEEKKPETYTVVKGDTLIGIAKKLGVDYADLKEANPQFYFDGKDSAGRKRESDGHWIYPGDKVNIPAKK